MKRLKSLNIWTHCTDNQGKTPSRKAPARGLGKLPPPVSYEKAKANAEKELANSPYYGFVFSDTSEYIGIDVDVDPSGQKKNATTEIPTGLLFFLGIHPTHVHYSPNGEGLHIIYRVDEETQGQLDDLRLNQNATDSEKGDIFAGDWRYRKSFLTFTENEHELSVPEIAFIDFDTLCQLIPSIQGNITPIVTPATAAIPTPMEPQKLPKVELFAELMLSVPATFDGKAQRACANLPGQQPGSNYDYWVLVGCACAHYALTAVACGRKDDVDAVEEVFLAWSRKDEEGYTTDGEVLDKFRLLMNSTSEKIKSGAATTTFGTLSLIAKNNVMDFPDMVKGGKSGKIRPDPLSTRNIQALMEHEQLELVFDPMGGGVAFKGPEETVTQWFCPQSGYLAMRPKGYSQICPVSDMAVRVRPFMQKMYAQSVTTGHARDFIDQLTQNMRFENAFKSWIDSVPWDGVRRFEQVYNSIEFPDAAAPKDTKLYKCYIRWSLLAMIGIHFWPEDSPKISAMLVLKGVENTFKSSWAEWLIPKDMGNYTATAPVEAAIKGDKDWNMFLATKATVVINECETLFVPKYEQKVKAAVDAESVSYRDPYGKQVLTRPRTALIIGTTNKTELFTGSNGTRKIWQIPVRLCDSMLIKRMDLQQLYAEILCELKEYKKQNPKNLIQFAWALTSSDRKHINNLNARSKGSGQGVMSLLSECFGQYVDAEFDKDLYTKEGNTDIRIGKPGSIDNRPNAWTITALKKYLAMEFPDEKIDRVALKYALEEYSGYYTSTKSPRKIFANLSGKFANAIVTKGRMIVDRGAEAYLMPLPVTLSEDPTTEDLS